MALRLPVVVLAKVKVAVMVSPASTSLTTMSVIGTLASPSL